MRDVRRDAAVCPVCGSTRVIPLTYEREAGGRHDEVQPQDFKCLSCAARFANGSKRPG